MSSKTKILILKKREAIYTAIFIALTVILLILLVLMFRPGGATASTTASAYVPGVYTTPLTLGGNSMELQVRVDKDCIHDICLVNLSESVTTMLPLMKPALDSIAVQIYETQSTQNIYYENSSQYTSQMLLMAIDEALALARK